MCVEEDPGQPGWKNWFFKFPEDDRLPGDIGPPCTMWDYVKLLLDNLIHYWRQCSYADEHVDVSEGGHVHTALHPLQGVLRDLWTDLSAIGIASAAELIGLAQQFARRLDSSAANHAAGDHEALMAPLNAFHEWLMRRFAFQRGGSPEQMDGNDEARRDLIVMDLGIAIIRGLIAEGALLHPAEFDSLDEELQTWLSRNGASDLSCRVKQSAVIRGLYDLVFAYVDGDTAQASFATGPALCSIFDMVLRL